MPREMDRIFAQHPSDLKGGGSKPPGPSRYFGLPMVNPRQTTITNKQALLLTT